MRTNIRVETRIHCCRCEFVREVPVVHAMIPRGIVLKTKPSPTTYSRTIVYSGDTAPCDALVDAGKKCDL